MVLQLSPCAARRVAAFTLVELLVTVSVVMLLGSLSYVSFRPFLQERRLRQAAVEIQAQLLQARTVAQKRSGSCQVSLSSLSLGPATGFTNNVCTATTLPAVSLSGTSNADGLAVVAGSDTTFTFTSIGSLAGPSDLTTILSANNTSTQWCVRVTAPAGLIMVGSRVSGEAACNFVRD